MRYLFILFCLATTTMIGQSDIQQIQNEIDQTVWKPFQKAFQTLDGNALNATYATDVLRVTPQGIDTQNTFKKGNLERFAASKEGNVSIVLDFWFDSRHTNADTSYEVGFYRIAATVNNSTTYSYGQFHIVLKKTNGQWKIKQDWDTAEINGHQIDKYDFEKHKPLKFN